jgi:hypothetical protein
MRAKYTNVRARSANEGSGTAGWSLTAPVLACFLMEEEDIAFPPGSLDNRVGIPAAADGFVGKKEKDDVKTAI